MKKLEAKCVEHVSVRCELGESPVWDSEENVLYWCDILGRKIYLLNLITNQLKEIPTPSDVGFVAILDKCNLLVGMQSGLYKYSLLDNSFNCILHKVWSDDLRINDGKINPSDNSVWFGTSSYSLKKNSANFYRFYEGHLENMIQGVTISNGLCWQGNSFFYIDSPTQKVNLYQIKQNSKDKLTFNKTIYKVDVKEGIPDGMCIDEKGWLWIAIYDGGKIIAIDSANGNKKAEIKTPFCVKPTSCCWLKRGSDELPRLYITSAMEYLEDKQRKLNYNSGRLMYAEIDLQNLHKSN